MNSSSAFLLLCLVGISYAHLFLRVPPSFGGLQYGGSKRAPCPGLISNPVVTVYEAGERVQFQSRGNDHGPGAFSYRLSYSDTNLNFDTLLAPSFFDTFKAGPENYNPIYTNVTIPAKTCAKCVVQLTGMAKPDGSDMWYNCAYISIVPVGSRNSPSLTSVSPRNSPTTGGKTITVKGKKFAPSNTTPSYCLFESVEVEATWVSNNTITCLSPRINSNKEGLLRVRVGKELSADGMRFNFTGQAIPPVITSLEPASGLVGTTITVKGEEFLSRIVQCQFTTNLDDVEVVTDAIFIDSRQVVCDVPAELANGTYRFNVIVDGTYSAESKSFEVTVPESSSLLLQPFSLFILVALVSLFYLF